MRILISILKKGAEESKKYEFFNVHQILITEVEETQEPSAKGKE